MWYLRDMQNVMTAAFSTTMGIANIALSSMILTRRALKGRTVLTAKRAFQVLINPRSMSCFKILWVANYVLTAPTCWLLLSAAMKPGEQWWLKYRRKWSYDIWTYTSNVCDPCLMFSLVQHRFCVLRTWARTMVCDVISSAEVSSSSRPR